MAPLTRKRKSELEMLGDISFEAPPSEDSKPARKLPVRAKDGEVVEPKEAPASTPAKGNMMVFTDEDNAEVPQPAPVVSQKPAAPAPEEDEEEDSDDEAPEAVSTTKVASDMKKSAQAAQKAAQEQAAAQKRKRQQRDTLFKQQAEERKKADEESRAAEKAAVEESAAQAEALGRRRRADKIQVPSVLPAEFLTDSSSEDEDEEEKLAAAAAAARSKKRKIATVERSLTRESRGPRDERVGSTVYRVAKKADDRMAPKMSKHTKSSKDLLLKRNRAAVPARRR